MSWSRFHVKLANKMDIPESRLNIVYKLSFEPKANLSHCLSTTKHLLQMISITNEHLLGKFKLCSWNLFAVIIVDKTSKDTTKKGGTKVSNHTEL
jgi:hypothetical protein